MRRIILVASVFFFLGLSTLTAQTQKNVQSSTIYSGRLLVKKYKDAYPNWIYLMDSCQKLSINIYKYGDKLAKERFKNAADKNEGFALVKKSTHRD